MSDLIQRAREFAALADKATPGPWEVHANDQRTSDGEGFLDGWNIGMRYGDKGQIVDFVRIGAYQYGEPEAHLVAAAPDMAKLLAEMADELERIRQALRILANAVDPFLADQSQATDERVALVQPVTMKEAEELNAACREAREVLENADLD